MLVDTDAVRALGEECSAHARGLSVAADTLKALPGPEASAALGPVGAGFLSALGDAAAAHARAVAALGDDLASAHPAAGQIADAYTATDRHGSALL